MKPKLVSSLAAGPAWIYEIKFDGYRAIAVKNGSKTQLFSRNENDLSAHYPELAQAVARLPCKQAVLDGEIVALDPQGRFSFQLLQQWLSPGNHRRPPVRYYFFDLLELEGRDLTGLPLTARKEILATLLAKVPEPLRFSASLEGDPDSLLAAVRQQGLEGIVAKLRESKYESGRRSGAWLKCKTDQSQEFVIGGYTQPRGTRKYFGALLIGYHEDGALRFASKVGTGFDTHLLRDLFAKFSKLRSSECPFVNLPEKDRGRWGQGLTKAEMSRCVWLKPELVAQVRFTEW
ncbi:MAG: non-homologous end-joining DNA ligase, partial [Verrucomicrobiae bacterium]|nr:non-homologous end-joining DNA ligase [Verrucomicrobiae bacterium]